MKTTAYFEAIRQRADRSIFHVEWIERAIRTPLQDGETVHNAFFDRGYVP
jgi:hypothetical protein